MINWASSSVSSSPFLSEQLMFLPPTGVLPPDPMDPASPLKKILLWNGASSWGGIRYFWHQAFSPQQNARCSGPAEENCWNKIARCHRVSSQLTGRHHNHHLSSHVSVESVTTSVKVKRSFWKSDWYYHLNVPLQPDLDHHVYFIKAYDHIFTLTGGMQKSQTWYCSKTISLHQLTGINTMKRRRKINMEKNLKKAKYTIQYNPIP